MCGDIRTKKNIWPPEINVFLVNWLNKLLFSSVWQAININITTSG